MLPINPSEDFSRGEWQYTMKTQQYNAWVQIKIFHKRKLKILPAFWFSENSILTFEVHKIQVKASRSCVLLSF
jgi:hypothetical protein